MSEGEGTEQPQQRYCGYCGTQIKAGNMFCTSCGESLVSGATGSRRSGSGSTANPPASEDLKKFAQNSYQGAKRTYEQANAAYREHSESRAAERERVNRLRAIQREREDLLGQVARYEKLFKRAYDGASFSLDWWRAYEDEESVDEEPATPDLLRSVQERAQEGMEATAEIKSEVENTPYEEGQGIEEKTERSLNNLKVRQENFKGEESIFPPLVEVHRRVKGAEEWTRYRKELEEFIRRLEDILGSPEVRTAAANRARFPDPSTTREAVEEHSCPRCGVKNNPDARFCSNCGAGIRSGPAGQGQSPSNQMSAQPLQENGVLWVLLSVVCAAVALFFLPPLFGGLGVFLGYRAKQVGNEGGGIAMMVVSGACMLLGMLWGSLMWGVY